MPSSLYEISGKENAYEASPCHKQRAASRSDRVVGRGFLSRLQEAKEDASEQVDRDIASAEQRGELRRKREAAERRKRDEEEGLAAALKLESELNDHTFALQLQESESKLDDEWERSDQRRLEEDQELAERIEREMNRVERNQRKKGEEMANKLQNKELRAFLKRSAKLEKAWSQPKLDVTELSSGAGEGIQIVVHLPELDTVDVKLDDSREVIIVRAVPLDARIHEEADRLMFHPGGGDKEAPPHPLSVPKAIKFAIDLRIVGSANLTQDDVAFEYHKKTGDLEIAVQNVELSPDYKKPNRRFALVQTLSRKLGSFRRKSKK